MTFTHALSTNNYGPAKFIVSADPANGTHTTIAAALTASSSGDTIFIRQGSYTENLSLKPGVNLSGWPSDGDSGSIRQTSANFNAKIIGKLTLSSAGYVCISNLFLQTNSDFIISTSGAVEAVVFCKNCYLYASNNTAISCASSTGSCTFENCSADIGTTGITYFTVTSGANLAILGGVWANTGASTTASTYSSTGNVTIRDCEFICPLSSSGTAGGFSLKNVFFNYDAANTTMLTHNSTGAGGTAWDCWFLSGTASAISVGSGATMRLFNTKITSSNTNAITGAGSIEYSGVTFPGTSNLINTTTQTKDYVNHGKWKASGQSAFLAYNSVSDTNQTGSGATATVDFDTEVYDQDSNFSADTFTAPITGRYLLTTTISYGGTSAGMTTSRGNIVTSNRSYEFGRLNPEACKDAAVGIDISCGVVADMDASDTATVTLFITGGAGNTATIVGGTTFTYFSGCLLA